MTFESAFSSLEGIIRDEEAVIRDPKGRNEAQTRFDLIDRILKEVLGWSIDKMFVEDHDESGYTDYELRDPGTVAIVEAKREGVSFRLPDAHFSGRQPIKPLILDPENLGLKAAMQQVMRYANTRGTATCIVSNGPQWIAFLGSRTDGTPPLEGKALVFPSLEAIRDNFVLFHSTLCFEGIQTRRIFSELSLATALPPAPLAAALSDYPGTKRRNTVQTNLQFLGQALLEDMPREEAHEQLFLTQCYATSGALSSYAQLSKDVLASRNATMLQDLGALESPASLRKGLNPQLSQEALAAAAAHRPIVLLGGVGVGKSTFIHHLVKVDAKSVFQNAIAIRVDYGQGATFSDPSDYAIETIDSKLREDYGIDIDDARFVFDLYRDELRRFEGGIYGSIKDTAPNEFQMKRVEHVAELAANRAEHIRRAIDRITSSHRRQVVIFLDNIDQRGHEDQNEVFLTAIEIAAKWKATVFITLRPETYYVSRRYGAVSGYHPRVFSIAPPRCDVMVKKRIEFALNILDSGTDPRASGGVGIESERLELFLRVLEKNMTRNRNLVALLENLAGGNMRRALEFVTQFIGSGHVDTQKIIAIEESDPGSYFIPLHEFLRSLLHGDNEYYDPSTSPIANLYAIDRPDPSSHFLAPIALHYIMSRGEAESNSGFVGLSEVYQFTQGLGFDVSSVEFALNKLGHHKLIEAPLDNFDPHQSEQVRITTIGAYTLTNLPRMFTYNDAVIIDTPITSSTFRLQIKDVRQMADRIGRVKLFREYMDECWERSDLQASGWDWAEVSSALESDLRTVSGKANVDYSSV
jgi:Cdc6-like AAA superfamily ATPase